MANDFLENITGIQTRFMDISKDFERMVEIELDNSLNPLDPEEFWQIVKRKNVLGVVATDEYGVVIGFCVYSLEEKDCFSILNLVVDKPFHRQGIATKIINKMKYKLNDSRTMLKCEVSEMNLPVQCLLRANKFTSKLIRRYSEDFIDFTYTKEGV